MATILNLILSVRLPLSSMRGVILVYHFSPWAVELISLSDAARISLRVKNSLEEIVEKTAGVQVQCAETAEICCDNRAATLVATSNTGLSNKIRHIRIRHLFCRELVRLGTIAVKWIKGTTNSAGALTKPLARQAFERCMRWIGLRDLKVE